jgi:hypothetical protein
MRARVAIDLSELMAAVGMWDDCLTVIGAAKSEMGDGDPELMVELETLQALTTAFDPRGVDDFDRNRARYEDLSQGDSWPAHALAAVLSTVALIRSEGRERVGEYSTARCAAGASSASAAAGGGRRPSCCRRWSTTAKRPRARGERRDQRRRAAQRGADRHRERSDGTGDGAVADGRRGSPRGDVPHDLRPHARHRHDALARVDLQLPDRRGHGAPRPRGHRRHAERHRGRPRLRRVGPRARGRRRASTCPPCACRRWRRWRSRSGGPCARPSTGRRRAPSPSGRASSSPSSRRSRRSSPASTSRRPSKPPRRSRRHRTRQRPPARGRTDALGLATSRIPTLSSRCAPSHQGRTLRFGALARSGSPARARKSPAGAGLHEERMMGLEPTTFCMASRRSSQLSYIRARQRV